MKHNLARVIAAAACCLGMQPAFAEAPVCIQGYNIQTTERPDDNTILFHMKDGTTYVNHTVGRCVGLAVDPDGFTFSPTDPGSDEYCSNLVTIRLNTSKNTCFLGAFVKAAK